MTRPDSVRRELLAGAAALAATLAVPLRVGASPQPHLRRLPGGELVPAIGMGTWITFDVGSNAAARAERARVLEAFFAAGGTLIDSSPMYRSAEEVIGHTLSVTDRRADAFSATKVWKYGREAGIDAMETSRRLWGVERFDLMQIHNMLDWRAHLGTLREMKADGRIRYIGITTSHGRRHGDFRKVISDEPDFDVVQFTYNVTHRDAEKRLLPAAAEHGKAVIINRPFDGGRLFDAVRGKALPEWAAEIGCRNWAQVFLKFVLSHPAVTCAIPATSRVDHMRENMGALHGPLPDEGLRRRIIAAVTG